MDKTAMHKKMCDQLPWFKKRGKNMMKRKRVCQEPNFRFEVAAGRYAVNGKLGQKNEPIDD